MLSSHSLALWLTIGPAQPTSAENENRPVFLNLTGIRLDTGEDSRVLEYAPWTQEEKATVESDLVGIETCHPDLMKTLWKQTPKLFMAKTKVKSNFAAREAYLYTATTLPTKIVLNPRYFSLKQMRRGDTLFHELIHRLDIGQRVCLGKNWGQLSNPSISQIRVQIACGQIKPCKSPIDPLPKELGWPNYYSCQSPVEALAVYCSETQRGLFPERREFTDVVNDLLYPTDADLAFAQTFQEGQKQLDYHMFEKAAPLFRKAVEIHPDVAMAHFKLAYCLAMRKRFEPSLIELEKANALLSKSGLPPSETHYAMVLELEAHALGSLKKWKELKASYNRRLLYDPDNLRLLRRRMLVNEQIHNWKEAAFDCYELKYHRSNITTAAIKAACDDDRFTQDCLELALNKQRNPDPLARPTFFYWLAEKSTNKQAAKANLEQVLQTLPDTSIEPDDREVLLRAKTLIQLERYAEASALAEKMQKAKPGSAALLVIQIALKQVRREPSEEDYAKLKELIGKV